MKRSGTIPAKEVARAANEVAIFTRVSTTRQATDRQAAELAELAERNGWQVVATITETISGTKDSKHRPELQRLRELAQAGKISKVLVSEISRLGRRVSEVTTLLDELTALKVSVYIKQLGNETLNERGERNVFFMPALHVLLSFAEAERETLRERVISGMKHAASKGRHAGRPKGSRELSVLGKHPKAERLLKDGQSIRNAAKIAGISPTTVQKIANELKQHAQCAQ